jgi:hypothetical protein
MSWIATDGATSTVFHNLAGGTLQKSGGNSAFVIDGIELSNDGVIHIEKGAFQLRSDFVQSAGGRLETVIAGLTPGQDFGRMEIAGKATLDGAIDFQLDSGFILALGDPIEALTYGSHSGEFQDVSLHPVADLMLSPKYDDTKLTLTAAPVVHPLIGDVNGDGKVNVQDATISLRIAVGLEKPTDAQKTTADANKDGKLTVADTTLILQVAVGLKKGL